MSWRDGQRFLKWWEENGPAEPFDENLPWHCWIRQAYEQGYSDGFREGRTYDPQWDSD